MSTENAGPLERRLEQLEHELHILRLVSRRDAAGRKRAVLSAVFLGVALTSTLAFTGANGAQPTTVRTPFTVVDKAGKPVMLVTDKDQFSRGLYIFNGNNQGNAAHLGVLDNGGGRLTLRTGVGSAGRSIGMGYFSEGPLLEIQNPAGKTFFRLNERGLLWANSAEASVVRLGAAANQTGYVTVGDANGQAVASMTGTRRR